MCLHNYFLYFIGFGSGGGGAGDAVPGESQLQQMCVTQPTDQFLLLMEFLGKQKE